MDEVTPAQVRPSAVGAATGAVAAPTIKRQRIAVEQLAGIAYATWAEYRSIVSGEATPAWHEIHGEKRDRFVGWVRFHIKHPHVGPHGARKLTSAEHQAEPLVEQLADVLFHDTVRFFLHRAKWVEIYEA